MAWSAESGKLTVREVMDIYPKLGIPHFQRGLVWGPDSTAALLESLFYETPCGSFVFWKSTDNSRHGVRLDSPESKGIDYLILDGQQRIRNIHAALTDEQSDPGESTESGPRSITDQEKAKRWCVNLAKAPGFSDFLEPRRDFGLFVCAVDPRDAKDQSALRRNLLPLGVIRGARQWSELPEYHGLLSFKKDSGTDAVRILVPRQYEELRARVMQIFTRSFFVAVRETDDVAEMARLYNRINAGGKRVETEERAFARLVGIQPGTWKGLSEAFALVHGVPDASRDAVLERAQERAFGFKLFIRMFLQVCHHHFGYSLGKNAFSFDIAQKDSFLRKLADRPPADSEWLWSETKDVIKTVRDLLREQLFCDDLRFLPDALSLTPLYQLLIAFPPLREACWRPLLAAICLRLMLADPDAKALATLTSEASDPGRVAFQVIPGIFEKTEAGVREKLAKRLARSDSIQDRYVLLLYWLTRRGGARDFLHRNVPEERRPAGPEKPVCRDERPEKQHMVPFSRLVKALREDDARRGASHRFNDIANFTYISHKLNTLSGLGDQMVDLKGKGGEAPEPEKNLVAHLLRGTTGSHAVEEEYEKLRELIEDEDLEDKPRKDIEESFLRFCTLRRDLVRAGFQDWLGELDAKACRDLGIDGLARLPELALGADRIEPIAPRFLEPSQLSASHVVRSLGFDHEVEDALITVASRKGGRVSRDKGKLTINLTKRKLVWIDVTPGRIELGLHPRTTAEHRNMIRAVLRIPEVPASLLGDAAPRRDAVFRLKDLADQVAAVEEAIVSAIRAETGEASEDAEEGGFESEWSKVHGEAATLALLEFYRIMEAAKVEGLTMKPAGSGRRQFQVRIRSLVRPLTAVRPRLGDGTIAEILSRELRGEKEPVASALTEFRNAFLRLPGAASFGAHGCIQIPVADAAEKGREILEILGNFIRNASS